MRDLRNKLGVSQLAIATIVGIWHTTYNQIELGHHGCTLEHAKKIVEAFRNLSGEDLTIDGLFFDETDSSEAELQKAETIAVKEKMKKELALKIEELKEEIKKLKGA